MSLAASPSYAQTMARSVDLSEAARNFAALAEEVLAGQEVILSKAGKPVIKLVALGSDEIEITGAKESYRKLGAGAKFLENFDWDKWEESDGDLERVWKKLGYMD